MTSGPAGFSLQDDVRANPFVADAKVHSRGCRSTRPATGILRATRVPSLPTSGRSRPDADRDGHRAASAGGDDCDDTDPAAWQDCDTGGGTATGTTDTGGGTDTDSGADSGGGTDTGTTDTGTDTGGGNDTSATDSDAEEADTDRDGPSPKRTDEEAGGCNTSGGGPSRGVGLVMLLGALAARVRRRAR